MLKKPLSFTSLRVIVNHLKYMYLIELKDKFAAKVIFE